MLVKDGVTRHPAYVGSCSQIAEPQNMTVGPPNMTVDPQDMIVVPHDIRGASEHDCGASGAASEHDCSERGCGALEHHCASQQG